MLPCRTKHGINVWKACPECKSVANAILHIEICIVKALVVESPYVIPSVCVHNNTQEQKTDKKWGRPGSIHHVDDVRWTLGGCRVGGMGPSAKTMHLLNTLPHFWTPDISMNETTRLDQ